MNNNCIEANDILVSIICTAYNHEDYIEKALTSFLNQKTTFNFEVLVNDDASTDRTAEIIRSYELRYPDIIFGIYQKENQYSQKINIPKTFLFPKARGKYIAICEGDDYWTSEEKLEKQVQYLESHEDCVCCVHSGKYIFDNGKDRGDLFRAYSCSRNVDIKDSILYWLVPTASFLFKQEFKYIPEEITSEYFGDVPRLLYLLTRGNVYYLDESLSAYRLMSKSSLSKKRSLESIEFKQKLLKGTIDYYKRFDVYTNLIFTEYIKKRIVQLSVDYNVNMGNYKVLKTEYPIEYGNLTLKTKLKIIIKNKFPKISVILIKIKNLIFGKSVSFNVKNKCTPIVKNF